jgi:hypothetical protein
MNMVQRVRDRDILLIESWVNLNNSDVRRSMDVLQRALGSGLRPLE